MVLETEEKNQSLLVSIYFSCPRTCPLPYYTRFESYWNTGSTWTGLLFSFSRYFTKYPFSLECSSSSLLLANIQLANSCVQLTPESLKTLFVFLLYNVATGRRNKTIIGKKYKFQKSSSSLPFTFFLIAGLGNSKDFFFFFFKVDPCLSETIIRI